MLINIAGVSDNNPPGFPLKIQVALKCNVDAMFFFIPCSLSVLIVTQNNFYIQPYTLILVASIYSFDPSTIYRGELEA